jgi:3-oxoacyl-[acyl-carrier-protein] synthase III
VREQNLLALERLFSEKFDERHFIEAMRSRLRLPERRVWNEILHLGNTSSSSIPLALDTVLRLGPAGRRIGLCTCGAGYTRGAALLRQV